MVDSAVFVGALTRQELSDYALWHQDETILISPTKIDSFKCRSPDQPSSPAFCNLSNDSLIMLYAALEPCSQSPIKRPYSPLATNDVSAVDSIDALPGTTEEPMEIAQDSPNAVANQPIANMLPATAMIGYIDDADVTPPTFASDATALEMSTDRPAPVLAPLHRLNSAIDPAPPNLPNEIREASTEQETTPAGPQRLLPSVVKPVKSSRSTGQDRIQTKLSLTSRVISKQEGRAKHPSPATLIKAAEKLFSGSFTSVTPEPVEATAKPEASTSKVDKAIQVKLQTNTPRLPASRLPVGKTAKSRLEQGTVASRAKATVTSQPKTARPPGMSQAQLQAFTNSNTARNRQIYNKHETITVHKDCPRPPSPSERLRRAGDDSQPTQESRTVRAKKRETLRESLSQDVDAKLLPTDANRRHMKAPGDEDEGYQSPLKRKASKDGYRSRKAVKWEPTLVAEVVKAATKPSTVSRTDVAPALARTIELDSYGNVAAAKLPLSPIVPRQAVKITKLVYADDSA